MTRKMLAALTATMVLALPATASAGNGMEVIVDGHAGTETRSMAVTVADLDLARTHDARLADSRITRAAKQVCGWVNGTALKPTREYRACFGSALSDARDDLSALIQAQRQG